MANQKPNRLVCVISIVMLSFFLLCQIPSAKAGRCSCNLSSRRCQLACGTVSSDAGHYVFPFKRSDALLTRLAEVDPDDLSGTPMLYETEPRSAFSNYENTDLLKYYSWLLAELYDESR
ncbi:uncharacterized protein [Apostichopus japonicus]|uniref:uncharacterized protein n=1 Tax=Stichopus japonicus TaxID=307972 RepID=UPI003AB3D8C4